MDYSHVKICCHPWRCLTLLYYNNICSETIVAAAVAAISSKGSRDDALPDPSNHVIPLRPAIRASENMLKSFPAIVL